MKRKTRKFASGGDIITGLGAVLIGKALYDKYVKEGKGADKDDDYASRVKEYNAKNKPAEEPVSTDKKEPSAGEKRAMAASQGRPELVPEGADEAVMRSDNYPSRKPVVKTTPKKAAPAAPVKKAPVASESSANTTPPTYYTPKPKKAEPVSKPYPQAEATARLKKAEAERRAGQGLTPREEYKGIGSRRHIEGLKLERSQRLEEEAKKQFEKNKRENEANKGMKRGGTVKKYASGGTATSKPEPKKDTMPEWAKNERANRKQDELNKREAEGARKEVKRNMSTFGFKKGGSASSRADGIAIRGKTRA